MGQPSLGIYAFELFNFYNVQKIIRVGTCGVFREAIQLGDVVVALSAGTENSLASQSFSHYTHAPCCDYELLSNAVPKLRNNGLTCHIGTISASDYFYQDQDDWWTKLRDYGVLGVDMETHMLYTQALKFGRGALTVNLVSDNIATHQKLSSSERVTKVDTMVKSILESL
jgi:purine-nucleoside phosphorylase